MAKRKSRPLRLLLCQIIMEMFINEKCLFCRIHVVDSQDSVRAKRLLSARTHCHRLAKVSMQVCRSRTPQHKGNSCSSQAYPYQSIPSGFVLSSSSSIEISSTSQKSGSASLSQALKPATSTRWSQSAHVMGGFEENIFMAISFHGGSGARRSVYASV